jgi:putative hydrolase
VSDHPHQQPTDPEEPDFAAMLASLLGGADNPEVTKALGAMGIDKIDPATMGMIGAQLKAMMSGDAAEPFNLELATDVARKTVAAQGDSSIGNAARLEIEEAVQIATLWLADVTDLSAVDGAVHAWSRAEWVDQTMPMWRELVEPVAVGVSTAVVAAMRAQMGQLGGEDLAAMPGLPAGMDPSALMGQLEPMLARMSGSMFGAQVGQAVGALATDLVSGTDVGLPLVPGHGIALMPANIESFADGLEVDLAEVRLYLAVREAARVGLFAEVAWLGPQLVAAVQAYARDISIDTEGIESALQSIDPSDPAAMQAALSDSLFTPEPSPAQRSALTLLETYLALVEGWVDVVADRAASTCPMPRRWARPSGGAGLRAVRPSGSSASWSGSSCGPVVCATQRTCGRHWRPKVVPWCVTVHGRTPISHRRLPTSTIRSVTSTGSSRATPRTRWTQRLMPCSQRATRTTRKLGR